MWNKDSHVTVICFAVSNTSHLWNKHVHFPQLPAKSNAIAEIEGLTLSPTNKRITKMKEKCLFEAIEYFLSEKIILYIETAYTA